jgi:predicted branched-subunit amino acid permease
LDVRLKSIQLDVLGTGSLLGGLFADQVAHLPKFLQAALDFLLPALFLSFLSQLLNETYFSRCCIFSRFSFGMLLD